MAEKHILQTNFELRLHDFLARAHVKLSAGSTRDKDGQLSRITIICKSVANEIKNCEYRFNRKVLEQIGIGSLFNKLLRYFIAYTTTTFGKNDVSVKLGHDMAKSFMKDNFGYSANALSIDLRIFVRFSGNAEAARFLTSTDMRLLAQHTIPDECISVVIGLRRINPTITAQQVKNVVATFKSRITAPLTAPIASQGS